jgi:hypothetical protein
MGKTVSDIVVYAEAQYDIMPVTILSEINKSLKVHSYSSTFIAYICIGYFGSQETPCIITCNPTALLIFNF